MLSTSSNPSLPELQRLVSAYRLEEQRLTEQLQQLQFGQTQLHDQLQTIKKQLPDFDAISTELQQLTGQIEFTAGLAAGVSGKIRRLDRVRAHVASCLRRVDDILELKHCRSNVERCLNEGDFERAAAHIRHFRSIDVSALQRSSTKIADQVSSSEDAFASLKQTEAKLKQLIEHKFADAVQADNEQDVQRFARIFPLLDEHSTGLRLLGDYLLKRLAQIDAAQTATAGTPANNEETHISQLATLFESIAQLLNQYQPLIKQFYGSGHLCQLAFRIQAECDQRSRRILTSFDTKRKLKQLQANVQRLLKNVQTTNQVRIDPLEIDLLLNEIVQLTFKSETYLQFLIDRCLQDLDAAYAATNSLSNDKEDQVSGHSSTDLNSSKCASIEEIEKDRQQIQKLCRDCDLSRMIQELNGLYVLFEEYFLRESVIKAIVMDDLEPQQLHSSVLHDVFFILNKCIKRAFSSRSIDVLCATLNYSISILHSSYYEALYERLRNGYPSSSMIANALDLGQAYNVLQSSRYLGSSSSDIERNRLLFLISLNNLDEACNYCDSMRNSIRSQAVQELPSRTQQQQLGKLDSCLLEFNALISKFRLAIKQALVQLVNSILKPKVKAFVDSFCAESHVLNEQEILTYEASEGLRDFTQQFLVEIDSILNSLKAGLTYPNYERLIEAFCEQLTQRLETAIKKCIFNKLGGFQFNRELRALMNYLTASSSWSIRDKFSRLKYISTLLNAETLDELMDLSVNQNDVSLSEAELKLIIPLRCDFKFDEIRRIRF